MVTVTSSSPFFPGYRVFWYACSFIDLICRMNALGFSGKYSWLGGDDDWG